MGCTASKLDNEDTVRRCKERRRFMKEAVYARHHLAAAHSDYCLSLRVTGSALTSFAAGEPLSISDHSPAILLPTTNSNPPRVPSHSPPPPSVHTPPPQRPFTASLHYNQHRTKPPIKLPHILSESSISSSPKNQQNPNLYTYRKEKPPIKLPHILSESSISSPPKHNPANNFNTHKKMKPKLPHILSDSSISSTPRGPNNHQFTENYTYDANATYSRTPSQASSVWNWENFYPPSPPDSDFFNNKDYENHQKGEIDDNSSIYSNSKYHKHNPESETASVFSNYEKKANNHHPNQQAHLHHLESDAEAEEEETEMEEREEVHCSEWGDHYSTTSSSSDDDMAERESKSEVGTRSNFGSSVHSEAKAAAFQPAETPMIKPYKFDDDAGSSVSWNNKNNAGSYENEISDRKVVVRHRDLAEIVAAIKEYFDKAASSGEQVSEMLEIGRAQLDRSFSQLKKTVYHSSGVLSNLSSSWTSKPPLAVKYRFEPGSIDEPGGSKSLCSVLERLLAWEKKLYQEVKAREGVKIEHEKKLAALQSQEYKGDGVKLEKTKASIKRLQSLILVTSQAVSTTFSAINGLRDAELVPQLVELCHGFMYMWRSMNQFHEVQNHIVQQVRGLINRSAKGESTSDLHRQATRDLESAVSVWHSSFCRLIKFQRDFICSLHGWFMLSLIPINNEPTNGNMESPEAFSFCDEWKLALDRVPDTVASEAIKSFINVVRSIALKQGEELKIKKRTESASKELERKASSLRNIEKKYYHSYSMVGIGLPDTGPDTGHVLDARDPLSEKKSELAASQRRVEDEMTRHSKAVEVTRAMTLNNIQTGLPGVFQAMTSFSALIMESLEVVCTRSYAIK